MKTNRKNTKNHTIKIGYAALPLTVGFALLLGGCAAEDLGGTQRLTYDGSTFKAPKKAERILFDWTSFPLEDAMALDVKVSAVAKDAAGYYTGVAAEYAKDAEQIDTKDMDAVRAYDPDAVIMMRMENPDRVRQMSQIAPVIPVGGPQVDWKENLRLMAALTAQKKKGEKLIARYEKDAEAIAEKRNPERDKKALYLLSEDEAGTRFRVVPDRLLPTLYEDLGFRYPLNAEEKKPMLTLDQLSQIDPDYIFMDGVWLHEGKKESEVLNILEQDAKWRNLKAFEHGHVYLGALLEAGLTGTQSYSRMHLLKRIGEETGD